MRDGTSGAPAGVRPEYGQDLRIVRKFQTNRIRTVETVTTSYKRIICPRNRISEENCSKAMNLKNH
jgi:hypothetical protein